MDVKIKNYLSKNLHEFLLKRGVKPNQIFGDYQDYIEKKQKEILRWSFKKLFNRK